MECIYTLGTSSASHTYGNIASCIKVYLESFFPKDFLTRTYIDSKVAWKDINEVLGNGDREFKKRHYPFLIINPRFTDQDTNRYLYNTPLTKNMDNAESGIRRNTIFPFIKDRRSQMSLCYKLNRDEIPFEIELRLKSLPQQIDIYKNLENQLTWDRSFTHYVALESMIPRALVTYMGKIAGIDIDRSTEENNLIPLLIRHLNAHSRYPITYKVRNSTSVEEFFLYYQTSVLLTFTDLQMSDGQKKNVVDDYYSITFRVMAQFNLPGLYILMGSHDRRFKGLNFDAMVSTSSSHVSAQMIPLYTFTNLYQNADKETRDGKQFYSSTIVQLDKDNDGGDEVVDLRDVIAPEHMRVINQYLKDGIPVESLFRFSILKDAHELPIKCYVERSKMEENLWEVNWEQRRLIIYKGDATATYRILVYADMVNLNTKVMNEQDRYKTDKASL